MKLKICKVCSDKFEPKQFAQICCSMTCAITHSKNLKEKKEKKDKLNWSKEKVVRKKALLTHSDWLKLLQSVFNTYIRTRDKGLNCISCDCIVKDSGHASHYFSVGGHPNLRFNEDNCHLSCIECNLHKHGNLIEYSLRLPNRIGQDRFNTLVSNKNDILKLSIPEIEGLITHYRNLIKKNKINS